MLRTRSVSALRRVAVGVAAALLLGSGVSAAADPDAAPAADPDAAPSASPAAGPEEITTAGQRPVSGKNLKAGPPFTQTGGIWQVDRTTVKLSNTVTDADGDRCTLTFQVWTTDANGNPNKQVMIKGPSHPGGGTVNEAHGVIVSDYVASGSAAEVTVPYGNLTPGQTYVFRTSAYDGSLYETVWSPWGKFTVRPMAVNIQMPEPNKAAAPVNLAQYQEPQGGRRNEPVKSADGKSKRSCTEQGSTTVCLKVGEPDDLPAEQRTRLGRQLEATTDLVDWCREVPVGKDMLKRTSACLNKATPLDFQYTYRYPNGTVDKATARFASSIQIKLDPKSKTFQQQFALVPANPFITTTSGAGFGGKPLTMTPEFKCSPQCSTSGPSWTGSSTWQTSTQDLHSAYATFTHEWTGEAISDVSSLQLDWSYTGNVPGTSVQTPGWIGNSTPDFDVRCDDKSSTTPGCVFDAYRPTWVMNFAKTPGAVAHAWLIQAKLPNHPGSKAHGQPMVHFPASADPGGHQPDDNRKVICPDGWASRNGNPDATPLDANDRLSCDEFAYASSYNSGGMPAAEGGLNPVASGDACVQTHVTKLSSGGWRLRDDWRTSAPTWKEVCGRSAMSNWINTQSMQPFPATFSTPNRLLDQDEYWVGFPGFAHCGTASAQVTCTVPMP